MTKRIFILLILSVIFISCNKKTEVLTKTITYKRFKNDSLKGYTVRKYYFVLDTIKEKTIYYNLVGKVLDDKKSVKYIVKSKGLDIVLKDENTIKKFPYLITKLDSCYIHKHPLFNDVENCYKGKIDLINYSNLYKIKYNQLIIDGIDMNIYLDTDYTLVAKDSISYSSPFDKEIRVSQKESVSILQFLKR